MTNIGAAKASKLAKVVETASSNVLPGNALNRIKYSFIFSIQCSRFQMLYSHPHLGISQIH